MTPHSETRLHVVERLPAKMPFGDPPRNPTASQSDALIGQMAALFSGRVVAFAMVFAAPLVLVRVFSQDDYGLYKQLFLIHETLLAVLTVGLTASLYYFLPQYPDQRGVYIVNCVSALALIGLMGGGALLVFADWATWLVNNAQLKAYLPYLAAVVLLGVFTSALEPLLVIDKRAGLAALTGLASEALRAGMLLGAAVLTHRIEGVLVALVVWGTCRAVALLVYLRGLGIRRWFRPRWQQLLEQLRYSVPFGGAVVIRTIAESLHLYVVAHLYDAARFAVYSVGYLQIPLVEIAFQSASEVALVRLTELRRGQRLDEAVQVVRDTLAKLVTVLVPLYVWLASNARELIVLLYTERFEGSAPIFRIFLTTIPLTALSVDYVPRAFADTGFILRANVFRLCMSVVSLLALLKWGLPGMALATVASMAATKAVIALRVRTLFGIRLTQLFPGRRLVNVLLASTVAGGVAWLTGTVVGWEGGGRLLLSLGTFSPCYAGIVWFGGVIDRAEKREVLQALQKLMRGSGRGRVAT